MSDEPTWLILSETEAVVSFDKILRFSGFGFASIRTAFPHGQIKNLELVWVVFRLS